MYISGRELHDALENGRLRIRPRPEPADIGPNSIDLRLDSVESARVWDVAALALDNAANSTGTDVTGPHEVAIKNLNYPKFSRKYLKVLTQNPAEQVYQRGKAAVLRPGGFLLWQTRETVHTSRETPGLMCFINGRSTRARLGLAVHMTAPTIHAGWSGKITLEISNFGPFDLVMEEGDSIAQLTVAGVTGALTGVHHEGSSTYGQMSVMGT